MLRRLHGTFNHVGILKKKKKKDTASLSVAGKALCSLAIGLTYFNDKFVNFEDHEQIGLDKRFLYGPASASNESNYNGCSVCIYLHCTILTKFA